MRSKPAEAAYARTGQAILDLKGHTGHLTGVAISFDGKRIVATAEDFTAKVWDAHAKPSPMKRNACGAFGWRAPIPRGIFTATNNSRRKATSTERPSITPSRSGCEDFFTLFMKN